MTRPFEPANYFDGASLADAGSFETFCRGAVARSGRDVRFVHAPESFSRAPVEGLVDDVTRFGLGQHLQEAHFAAARARMQSVESVSLSEAVYAPAYCLVFSPQHGLYQPTAGGFEATRGGPDGLIAAYDAFELTESGVLALRNLPMIDDHDGIGIPICGMGFFNYGHFLFDGLSLAMFLVQRLRADGARLIGPPLRSWQLAVLEALGVADLYLPLTAPCRFRTLIASNTLMGHVSYPTRFARIAFDLIRLRLGVAPGRRDRRLFIVRSDTPGRRHLINRAEVIACAQMHGFEVIQPELLSLREQVQAFAAASVVMGESGAAMANIGFCDPGTQVLEIMPEIHSEIWIRGICLTFSHQWHVYFARVIDRPPAGAVEEDHLNFNYFIDINPLHASLQHICRTATPVSFPSGGGTTSAATPSSIGDEPSVLVSHLPYGLPLGTLESAGHLEHTYVFAEATSLARQPFFHANPIDPTYAEFADFFVNQDFRTYTATRMTVSALPLATVLGSSGGVAWQGHILHDSIQSIAAWRPETLIASIDNQIIQFKRPVSLPGHSLPGAWFHMFTGAWNNYAHWMTECMPKLALFKWLRQSIPNLGLLIPDFGASPFHTRTLQLLLPADVITRTLGHDDIVAPEVLWYAPVMNMWGLQPLCHRAAQDLAAAASADPSPRFIPTSERIYLHRQASLRRVVNFDALLPVLKDFGFTVICPETMSLDDQIVAMQRARFVVGEHGAGVANLMFCRPGARMLEMFNPACPQPAHWVLASVCAVDYGYLVGQHARSAEFPKPDWNTDYTIEPAQLAAGLRALVG